MHFAQEPLLTLVVFFKKKQLIPKPLEGAYFRTLVHDLLRHPHGAGLETLYAALLIEDNNYFLQSMPCLKTFLIPAKI
jgi:hypothetical protein